MSSQELTLSDVDNMARNPDLRNPILYYKYINGREPETYDDFVKRINEELDKIIRMLEKDRDLNNSLSEDALSAYIVNILNSKYISATHGEHVGGETDIRVSMGNYEWIAESKWFNSTENALEGMRQLVTRYATGGRYSNHGCVLLYNKTKNALGKVNNLKSIYEENTEYDSLEAEICAYSEFAFITKINHPSSGGSYVVRHRLVNLHHEPTDKSARNRKKNQSLIFVG